MRPTDDGSAPAVVNASDTTVVELDELTALALAARPDDPFADDPFSDDAVPFGSDPNGDGRNGAGLLPEWYMPAPVGLRRTRRNKVVVAGIIGSLLLVNGVGLCVTYGFPEIAW